VAKDVEFNYTASDKTGPAADSVTRRMKKTGEQVKKDNDKLSSDLAKNVVKLAEQVSPKLAATLTRGFSSAAEVGPQLLVGGIVAAAPLAGAAVSAAIIGAAGTGGIIGGVLLASKDARVQAAFAGMKARIGDELTNAAEPFVKTTIDGIGDIEDAVETIDFGAIFTKSAQNAKPVITGVSNAVRELGDGVENLVERSGPVMDQLGDSIADLGQHAGDFLSTVSHGSDGAAAGLRDVTHTVDTLLDVLGPTTLALSTVYGWLSKIGVAGQFMTDLLGPVGQIGDLLQKMGVIGGHASGQLTLVQQGVRDIGSAAGGASPSVQELTGKVDDLAGAGRDLYGSTTNVSQSIADLKKSLKDNGKTLDENTQKGRDNRSALLGVATALTGSYDAYVKVNGAGEGANRVLAANRQKFIDAAVAAGKSRDAAKQLADKLLGIPKTASTHINTNADDARDKINGVHTAINNLPSSKSVTVSVSIPAAQLRKVNNTLDRLGGGFSAGNSFAFAGPNGGSNEPARAPMSERIDNYLTVNVDGKPQRDYTNRRVRQASKRDAWRQKVGRR
jgi:hypothetical protein